MAQLKFKGKQFVQKHYLSVKYNKINVLYTQELDGGGRGFGQDYIPIVSQLFGKVDTICEFASGPGFIGFSLLAHGLCNKLCLVDINPKAIEICRETIKANHLEGKVTAFVSNSLDQVPAKEKWDLVVSNPPHFGGSFTGRNQDILLIDPKWIIHRKFYQKVKQHLQHSGSVLFVENSQGSSSDTFKKMIYEGNLTFIRDFRHKRNPLKILTENIVFILKRLNPDTIKRVLRGQMKVKGTKVANVGEYPLYFVWSKKI